MEKRINFSKLATIAFCMLAVCLVFFAQSCMNNNKETIKQVEELIALVPAPVLEEETTVINVHFTNFDLAPCSDLNMTLVRYFSSEPEAFTAKIDAETATAVFTLQLYGTARCHFGNSKIPFTSDVYLSPGETVDVWCDMTEVVKRDKTIEEVRRLNNEAGWTEGDEPIGPPIINLIPVTTNGCYAEVNNNLRSLRGNYLDVRPQDNLSSSELADSIMNIYIQNCKGILQEPGSDIQKAFELIELRLNAANVAATNSVLGKFTDKSDLKRVLQFLNLNDSRLLLGQSKMPVVLLYQYKDLIPDSPLVEYYEELMKNLGVDIESAESNNLHY